MNFDIETVLSAEQLELATQYFDLEDIAEDQEEFDDIERDTAIIAGWLKDELASMLEQAKSNKRVPVDSVCDEWNDFLREVVLFADPTTREAYFAVRDADEDDVDGFIDICNTAMATFKSVAK